MAYNKKTNSTGQGHSIRIGTTRSTRIVIISLTNHHAHIQTYIIEK